MSYRVRDETKIEGYLIFYSLISGKRVQVRVKFESDQLKIAQAEAERLPEGKVSPVYGWKTVETVYPTCPVCGHQGESTGMREYGYNGGGEHFRCLNPECEHRWCWS